MTDEKTNANVKLRAYSPGRHPILIVELPSGELKAAHFESGYDLERAKPVEENWLHENAIGRHSFIEANPVEEMPASSLTDYARREIIP